MVCKLRFNMSKLFYAFIVFFCVNTINANDTISKKYVFEIAFSKSPLLVGNYKYENTQNVYTGSTNANVLTESYNIKTNYCINLGINKKFISARNHSLNGGLLFTYLNFYNEHSLFDYSSGRINGYSVSFKNPNYRFTANCLGIVPNLSYQLNLNHLVLINKLGITMNNVFSNQTHQYTQEKYTWDYSTNQNKLVSSAEEQQKINSFSAHAFYALTFGVKLKQIIPTVNFCISQISYRFKNPYLSVNFGFNYEF